jgi:hypothetical protein
MTSLVLIFSGRKRASDVWKHLQCDEQKQRLWYSTAAAEYSSQPVASPAMGHWVTCPLSFQQKIFFLSII